MGTVPDAVIGVPPSGVVEAETIVTVHDVPVIFVVMDCPMGDAVEPGHQQEGPGPASPPGLMMQQSPTPEVVPEDVL